MNGDRVSGTLKAIRKGKVLFNLGLVEKTVEFPVENFSELSLAGPSETPPERSDTIYLRDGSYLSASVSGLKPDAVEAVTVLGQTITVPKDEVKGIGFYRRNDLLFESDFSRPQETAPIPVVGSWRVEKGQFVQASPLPFCRAYVPAVQSGVMRYEWAIDVSRSHAAGLIFFASAFETRFGQPSYMVTARGNQVYLYKVMGRSRHEGARKTIKSSRPLVRLAVEYDPRSGEIVLWTGKDILARLVDPTPIQLGAYVMLHTEGKAAFDDVRISHLVGTIRGITPEAGLDIVLFSNGDRVSGQVAEISEEVVLKNPYTLAETPIERDRVRSIVFAACPAMTSAPAGRMPRVSLWNGDLLFGNIVGMDDGSLTLDSSFAKSLDIARTSLRTITFPQPSSSAPETAPGSLLPLVGIERTSAPARQK